VAVFQPLNYRTLEELRASIIELREAKVAGGSFGYNLIVNQILNTRIN
jgi:nitronate monooxygenase